MPPRRDGAPGNRRNTYMPKLQRWLIAAKRIEVLDAETLRTIVDLGGQIGGGWSQVHQHICVNQENKEKIEQLLQERGFTVSDPEDRVVSHPELPRHPNAESL
jgi:hypothetical protein